MENNYNKEIELWKNGNGTIFEQIFEHAPDSMIIVNNDGKIIYNNKTSENMFNYVRDELIGKTVESLIPPRFRIRHIGHRKEYFSNPHVRNMGIGLALYGRRKDGTEFPADIMLSPLETDIGFFVLEVVRDITKQKDIEEKFDKELEIQIQERTSELERANESLQDEISMRQHLEESLKSYTNTLEEVNRVKDLFADIMRYNILDPLINIKMISETMKDEEDEIKRESLLTIKRDADKLIELIKNADKYTKLEAEGKLKKSMIDLTTVIRLTIDKFRNQLNEKNVKIEYLAKNKNYIMASPIIEDIFSNLIANTIKHSPEGSKIEVNIIDDDGFYKIYIKDWGTEITDEDKAKLFSSHNEIKNGVELILANRVAGLHEGNIWIEDNPEGGSVFFVKLPKK